MSFFSCQGPEIFSTIDVTIVFKFL
jgi:hypothetical protein